MKRTLLTVTVLTFLLCGAGSLAAQNADDAKFKKFEDSFFDAYFKFFPTMGTMQGYTKYDDKLEDPSQGAVEKYLGSLDNFNQELVTKIDRTKLSPDLQVEYEMIRDFLDLQILKLENSLFAIDNPLFYNELFINGIRSLVLRNPGSPAAAARAKALPQLVKRAKDNLKTPPQEYTQAAIKQMPAIIDFYRTELPQTAGSAPGLQAELPKAVSALEDYQRFLQGELLSRSTGSFRLGPDMHLRLLRMMSQGNLPILEEVVNRSKADYSNIRKAMGQICLAYFTIMYPDVNPDQLAAQRGVDQALNTVIQGVFDKIESERAAPEQFFDQVSRTVDSVKAFIQTSQVVALPGENLSLAPMPAYMADGVWFKLGAPGAWDQSGPYTLYVQKVPEAWSPEQKTGFMEEHNNYYLNYMAVQRILPGTFAPVFFTRQGSSPVARMCANQALLYGWSVPVEEMIVLGGYANYDLRMRLNQLKLMLKNVIDFQMDLNVHEGTWSKDQVLTHMARNGFMTDQEAQRRWDRIVLNPGLASLTYIGYQEILSLQKEYQTLKGESFNQKEFLQKVLSYGAIPLRSLRAKLAR
jgi:hypothetical protein